MPTDAERFRRVREVFEEVCDLPPAEVDAHLATLCGSDTTLAVSVRALLAAEREGSGRLEPTLFSGALTAPVPAAESAAVPADPSLSGARVAQYEIGERLGRGGMGEVYAGTDTTLRRRVALKAIRHDQRMSEMARRRFLREAQMLSSLDHPNICRIHDYLRGAEIDLLVLELIQGRSLREAQAEGLSKDEALTVAEQIADALAAAHAEGVVHRDLKPANVMLTTDGMAKVLDFGLARPAEAAEEAPADATPEETVQRPATAIERATDAAVGDDRSTQFRTAGGVVAGTLSAMSPEQLEGRPATAASDMYSFGLLAQELFTGEPPYDSDLGAGELFRAVRAGATREVSGIDRDLAALIGALKAPNARARPTAAAALTRLRWIRGKPRRRLRRGAAVALVAAFALGGLKYTLDLRRERAVANQRRAQAEDLIGFMLGDLRAKLEPLGRLEVLDDVGDKALDYFAAVPEGELSDDELFGRARALTQIGEVRTAQGRLESASEAFAEALTLAADLAERQPGNARYEAGLGAAHFWVGSVYWLREDLDAALASFGRYLEISERLAEGEPDNLEWLMELAYAHNSVGSVLKAKGEIDRAIEEFRESLRLKEQALARDPENLTWMRDLAGSRSWLADALAASGDLEGALAEHERHQATLLQLLAGSPDDADLQMRTADSYEKLGQVQEAMGRFSRAEKNYSQYELAFENLVTRDRSNDLWQRGLAVAQRRLGGVLLLTGRTSEALAKLESACALNRELRRKDPTREELAVQLGQCVALQATATLQAGAPRKAEALAREAVDCSADVARSSAASAGAVELEAQSYLVLGDVLRATSRPGEARSAFAHALTVIEPAAATRGAMRAAHLHAEVLLRLDRVDEAASILRRLEQGGYQRHRTPR